MAEKKAMLVRDIMTERVLTAKKDTPIKNIAHLMLFQRISGVPIVDEGRKLCGVVTTTDLFKILGKLVADRAFGSYDEMFKNKTITAGDIMTKEIVQLTPMTPIEEVIKISVYRGIRTFPIVENDEIVGIIGRRDVLNVGFSVIEK